MQIIINKENKQAHRETAGRPKKSIFSSFKIAIISLKINIKHNYIKSSIYPAGATLILALMTTPFYKNK